MEKQGFSSTPTMPPLPRLLVRGDFELRMEEEKHDHALPKFSVPKINIDDIKKASPYVIMSPRSIKQTSGSGKANCLCSPTTHVGSFRCRHHRTSLLSRHGGSVGSNLSELASKSVATATPKQPCRGT